MRRRHERGLIPRRPTFRVHDLINTDLPLPHAQPCEKGLSIIKARQGHRQGEAPTVQTLSLRSRFSLYVLPIGVGIDQGSNERKQRPSLLNVQREMRDDTLAA